MTEHPKDMMLAKVLPREALLPHVEHTHELHSAKEGWTVLRPERSAPIASIEMHSDKHTNTTPPFHRTDYRIPPLCLSKYSDVTILPHQLIMTASGDLSADFGEEFVTKEDRSHWYNDAHAAMYNGQPRVYPRLKDCSWHHAENEVDISRAAEFPIIEVDEPVIDITAWYGNNISHWLVDVLPRLWALPFIKERKFKVLIPERVPSGRPPFMAESLALFGLGEEDLIWFNNNRRYKIDTLYVPSRMASHYTFFSPEIAAFYEHLPQRIQNFKSGTDPLLYISRRDSPQRRCLNEAGLEEALKARGFRILMLTEVDFEERIALMRGAKLLAGACGAGMAHALMMQNYTKLFVTSPPDMFLAATLFQNIAAVKQQDMTLIAGTSEEGTAPLHERNWTVDLDATLTHLDACLKTL